MHFSNMVGKSCVLLLHLYHISQFHFWELSFQAAPRIPRRNGFSSDVDKGALAVGQPVASQCLQPFESGLSELPQGGQFGAQDAQALAGDAIRLTALFGRERLDPA